MRGRWSGSAAVAAALERDEPIARLLVQAEASDPRIAAIEERARARGVPVSRESAREMKRMTVGDGTDEVIAVRGRPFDGRLESLMAGEGVVLVLVGLRYPGNVGFILRSAEVAGAAGVVLVGERTAAERASAERASIHAERFLPIVEAEAAVAFDAASAAGRRLVAVETSGEATPWSLDLAAPTALVLGGESDGIPPELLARADETVRIPSRGFIPSYNVQAATSILLGEWLRQTEPARQTRTTSRSER